MSKKPPLMSRVIRIDSDFIRIPLLLLLFPFNLADFAVHLAWNAPRRFFKLEPWVLAMSMFLAGGSGAFVGTTITTRTKPCANAEQQPS